jgi:hypothetical protein
LLKATENDSFQWQGLKQTHSGLISIEFLYEITHMKLKELDTYEIMAGAKGVHRKEDVQC